MEPWAELQKAATKHKVKADLIDLRIEQLKAERQTELKAYYELFTRADETRVRTLRGLAIGELACAGEISDADAEALTYMGDRTPAAVRR